MPVGMERREQEEKSREVMMWEDGERVVEKGFWRGPGFY